MLTMTKELNYCCPTSLAFVKHIIEYSEIPAPMTLKKISTSFISHHHDLSNDCKINQYILWSLLAQQFPGNLSQSMWIDSIYDLLVASITSSFHPILRLHALVVFESFSLNGHLKQLYISKRLHHTLRRVKRDMERKSIKKLWSKLYATKPNEPVESKQFQFALDWSLSNVFLEVNNKKKKKLNSLLTCNIDFHQ